MADLELNGTIIFIGDLEKVSENFEKRKAVIRVDEDGKYPQELEMEFINERTKMLNNLNVGDKAKAKVDLRGRGYKKDASTPTRWFTNLSCWDISIGAKSVDEVFEEPERVPDPTTEQIADPPGDDLPF